MQNKILVIEDNIDIANLVMVNLRGKNMQVDHATDGKSGLAKALTGKYQLVILDLMLPGIDGMDVCRVMRSEKNYTPVLMLTAKTSELVARVNAILRRSEQYHGSVRSELSEKVQFGELCVDPGTRQVLLGDNCIELTAKEFDLLWHFANNPGRVYTRSQLLSSVWGYGHDGYEHTVNSHINRLRAKIERDPAKPLYVITVWGVGYKFSHGLQEAA